MAESFQRRISAVGVIASKLKVLEEFRRARGSSASPVLALHRPKCQNAHSPSIVHPGHILLSVRP